MTQKCLERTYQIWDLANKTLSKRYPRTSRRTYSELVLHEYLSKRLGFRVMQSVWLSKFCIDLFIPKLRVAIEVNGTVHNRGFKIVEDFRKDSFVMGNMGISVYEVTNKGVHRWKKIFADLLNSQSPISKKEEQVLLNRILVETLPVHIETRHLI